MTFFEKLLTFLKKTENHVKPVELEPQNPDPPIPAYKRAFSVENFTIPSPYAVYQTYGRPPKETDSHLEYRKAVLVTAKNLPGTWNSNSKKLYVHEDMEPFLREALNRCEELGVLSYIEKLGSYNHRRMRHDKDAPLSLHSWAIALDINASDNFPVYRSKVNCPPPFSKDWLKLYKKGMPYELVMAFKSVGFAWGGDWGNDEWQKFVEAHGVGYDHNSVGSPQDWRKVKYVDPMHFELVKR